MWARSHPLVLSLGCWLVVLDGLNFCLQMGAFRELLGVSAASRLSQGGDAPRPPGYCATSEIEPSYKWQTTNLNLFHRARGGGGGPCQSQQSPSQIQIDG